MEHPANTRIRLYGPLFTLRRKRGLPTTAQVYLPPQGKTGLQLAEELELPLDKIEGVFCNHLVYPLDHLLKPGDELAFVPSGVPGPHRYMLGIHSAGKN